MLARAYADDLQADEFTTLPTGDYFLCLALSGTSTVAARHQTRWVSARYTPGSIGLTAPGATIDRPARATRPRTSGLTRTQVRNVSDLMVARLHTTLDLDGLAEAAHVSKYHFLRSFKGRDGQDVAQPPHLATQIAADDGEGGIRTPDGSYPP